MPRLRTKALGSGRWIIVVACAILALASGVTAFYASPALVRNLLIAQIESRTHRSVSIDAVSLNPFTGRLVVRGFRLQEPDGKTPFTDFDRLDVRIRSLLRGHLWIREVTPEGSTVRIIRFAEGFNISDLIPTSGGSGRTLDVTVDRLVVTKGTVALEDWALAEPRTWYSENIEIDAYNLSTRRGDGRAVARSVTVGAPVLLEMRHVRLYPIHLEAAVTTSGSTLARPPLLPRDAAVVLEQGRAARLLQVALDARAGLRANVTGALEDVVLVRRGARPRRARARAHRGARRLPVPGREAPGRPLLSSRARRASRTRSARRRPLPGVDAAGHIADVTWPVVLGPAAWTSGAASRAGAC